MTILWLVLGMASIFVSGVVAHMASNSRDIKDMYMSLLGLTWGVYLVLAVMGETS